MPRARGSGDTCDVSTRQLGPSESARYKSRPTSPCRQRYTQVLKCVTRLGDPNNNSVSLQPPRRPPGRTLYELCSSSRMPQPLHTVHCCAHINSTWQAALAS